MAEGNTCEETNGVHPCDDGSGAGASGFVSSENEAANQNLNLNEFSQSTFSSGAKILLLADTTGYGTPALVNALTAAGHTVTVHAPNMPGMELHH